VRHVYRAFEIKPGRTDSYCYVISDIRGYNREIRDQNFLLCF